jgi:CO dehydrogenase nickel-insertion accessory protein CooC1
VRVEQGVLEGMRRNPDGVGESSIRTDQLAEELEAAGARRVLVVHADAESDLARRLIGLSATHHEHPAAVMRRARYRAVGRKLPAS